MSDTTLARRGRVDLVAVDADIDLAFADFIRLEVRDGAASPQTARTYRANVADFWRWSREAGKEPNQATEDDLKAYRRHLVEQGVKEATLRARLSAVRRFFAALVWRGLRADNPAAGLRAPGDRTAPEEAIRYLPADYLPRLLAVLPGGPTGLRDRALLALFGLQGARVSELAGLDVSDIDLDSRPARVRIRHGKGSKKRTLLAASFDRAALAAWLAVRDQVAASDEDAVFVTLRSNQEGAPGRRMTARSIRRRVDRYLTKAGLKADGVSCHSLRHSAATWSAASGVKVEAIQAMLGHANVAQTGVYAKVADRIRNNPAVALEQFLGLDASFTSE